MRIHKEPSSLSGKTVKIKDCVFKYGGREILVRDWWDRCSGYSWKTGFVNPVCTAYMMRASISGRTEMFNDEVVYGQIGSFMYLFHISELEVKGE